MIELERAREWPLVCLRVYGSSHSSDGCPRVLQDEMKEEMGLDEDAVEDARIREERLAARRKKME